VNTTLDLDALSADLRRCAQTLSPAKFAHVVCLTGRLDAMRQWYQAVLNARIAFGNEQLCFLSYDDEHHRIGLIRSDAATAAPAADSAIVHHFAFTYRDLGELFGNYLRLKQQGIVPFWCINHGPTTSMYYKDPDGHRVELQVDNFSNEECDAFFASGAYDENPIGINFDADEWIGRYLRGEDAKALTRRPPLPAGTSPFQMIRD